jgi:hypothetical protein
LLHFDSRHESSALRRVSILAVSNEVAPPPFRSTTSRHRMS